MRNNRGVAKLLAVFLLFEIPVFSAEIPNHRQDISEQSNVLKRINSLSADLSFLHPTWQKIMPHAILWLNKTLSSEFHENGKYRSEVLEHAENLASAFEKNENLLAGIEGSRIPLYIETLAMPKARSSFGASEANPTYPKIIEYTLSLPSGFPVKDRKYPIMLNLHGGSRKKKLINYVPTPFKSELIRVSPMYNTTGRWDPAALNVLLDEIKLILPVDERRIYLTGGSKGGDGTFYWAMTNPEIFAAIAPCSIGGNTFRAKRLKNVPIWLFHGEKDELAHIYLAEKMVHALKSCGANVKYTFFPNGGHNLENFIDFHALERWFLEHTRSNQAIPPYPIKDIVYDNNGVGEKRIVEMPPMRFLSMKIQYSQRYFHYEKLYEVFHKTGMRAQGEVISQMLPSLKNGMVNLLLPIPNEINTNTVPDLTEVYTASPCRALKFIFRNSASDRKAALERIIENSIAELRQNGETPTGEIRKTFLFFTTSDVPLDHYVSYRSICIILEP